MMPFMSQPAVAPACYVPKAGIAAQSLLFRADPSYLQRTPTVVGNRKLACLDLCVTPVNQGANRALLVAGDSTSDYAYIDISSADMLRVWIVIGGVTKVKISAVPVFRDVSTYHLRVVLDVENATADDRVRLYQDGARLPVSGTLALVPTDLLALGNAVTHRIGRTTLSGYIDQYAGLMADMVLVSGAVPDVFGERNIHGVWVRKPKSEIQAAVAAVGGFGTNGFHLDFSDPLNPGKDVSGQGNHWTVVGFDATGKDTLISTPTNVYATLNALNYGSSRMTLSGGGLTASAINGSGAGATILLSAGKWYFETCLTAGSNGFNCIGMFDAPSAATMGLASSIKGGWFISADGTLYDHDTVTAGYGAKASVGDRIMCAIDLDAGKIWWGRNGGWYGGGDPAAGTAPAAASLSGAVYPGIVLENGCVQDINFGQRPWAYVPPSGFKPLCTDNLPEPDIKDPSEAFVQVATTGANMEGALAALTGHWNGAPYVEIVKRRDASEDWRVRFSDDPGNSWATNNTLAKAAAPALVSEGAYVGYRLRVGARYGIWTAEVPHTTGTATTVTHGLNTTRAAVIATRVSAGGGDRYYRHPDLSAGYLLKLNSNSLAASDGTLTAFGADSFQIAAGAPSGTYRVLVMAARAGYLCLGAYAATGVAGDGGPFLAMDIAPLLLIQRRYNAAASYEVLDVVREPANPTFKDLLLNAPNAENTNSNQFDFVVGGVKCRTDPANSDSADSNASGGQHVYIAIGRPVGGVCVAPATAR